MARLKPGPETDPLAATEAERWLHEVQQRLAVPATDHEPTLRRYETLCTEVWKIRKRHEAAGATPAEIVEAVRAYLVEQPEEHGTVRRD